MDHIVTQLVEVRDRISKAVLTASRHVESVKLIAVSKTFSIESVETAYGAEQRLFGENKIQELEAKVPALPDDIEWHHIGHLQSNKAVKAVVLADYIHAVDKVKLVRRIDRLAGEASTKPKILLEVNISGEDSKNGFISELDVLDSARVASECENLELVGLMTMAPHGATPEQLRFIFAGLRVMRDNIEGSLGIKLPELSMGMSSDFEIAIEEGATLVRVGTAIFGKRDYSK